MGIHVHKKAPVRLLEKQERKINDANNARSYKMRDGFEGLPSLHAKKIKSTKTHRFLSQSIDIKAPIEKVWELVKQPENYKALSDGAIDAQVIGKLEVGSIILLHVFPDKLVGKIMGESKEIIAVVDEEKKSLGWTRDLPLSKKTLRLHVLEPLGPNLTRSYISLDVPGVTGALTSLFFRETIENAFTKLNQGIAHEAAKNAA